MIANQKLLEKWAPVLDIDTNGMGPVTDSSKRAIVAALLENTVKDQESQHSFAPQSLLEAAPTNNTSGIDNYDPVMINLIRRTMPNLIAYDIVGVQPMTGPSGLIFAMRSRYSNMVGDEAFYNEAQTGISTVTGGNDEIIGDSANNVGTTPTGNSETYNFAGGMSTIQAEALGSSGNVAFPEMAFDIDKITVTAKSRALKAEWSMETAQDLKAIHGLDAETELSKILSTELLADINREIIRTVYLTAKAGATGTTVAGTFNCDVDADGRWSVEKYKGLLFFIETEANAIAKATRRGKGNIIICSSNVASALRMTGVLDYNPTLAAQVTGLNVDDTGNTFAGILAGQFRVYIDPYATVDYVVVGYKGPSFGDQGIFYCPYVPLQMVRAVGENTFQPKIGFKTRYGVVANPFSRGATTSDGSLVQNVNVYYRRALVSNIQ